MSMLQRGPQEGCDGANNMHAGIIILPWAFVKKFP
jgi:hypothetical protein